MLGKPKRAHKKLERKIQLDHLALVHQQELVGSTDSSRHLENIVKLQVVESWPLFDAIFNYEPDASETTRIAELNEAIAALQISLKLMQMK